MVIESPPKPSFTVGRKWLIGWNVVVSILAALVIVLLVNYLAVYHFKRFYLTSNTNYRLSKLSVLVLKSLTNNVRVTVFFNKTDEPVLYRTVTALLNEYSMTTPRVQVERIDFNRELSSALAFKGKHKELALPDDKNFILFECNGKSKLVTQLELSEYNISDFVERKTSQIRRTSFRGEQLFTSAILSVSDPGQFKCYFVQGHNEHDPQNDSSRFGYHKFAALLNQYNIAQERLSLSLTNTVPPDCQLLVIAGPQKNIDPRDLEKISKYLDQSGRLLVLLNSFYGSNGGLEKLLADWSVAVGPNVALDEPNSEENTGFVVTTNCSSHPIVTPLFGEQLIFYRPRILDRKQSAKTAADAPRVDDLILTSSSGRAVALREGKPHLSAHDRRGALPLAVAIEKGAVRGVAANRGATRIVVIGDSYFLDNELFDWRANADFARLVVNWLLDRPQLLGGIMPRPVKEYRLVMTQPQRMAIRWILLAGIPGGVLLFGLVVWSRRRQ